MSDEVGGIRKEFLQMEAFRMLVKESLTQYPEIPSFNVHDATEKGIHTQTELWKSKSSEQKGFDLCFKMMTGYYPKEFNNE